MSSRPPVRWSLAAAAALTLIFAEPSRRSAAPTPDPLAPFAFLAGGTWEGRGTWPDGSPLHVELHYTWGVTHRLLHFTTYDLAGSRREPLYDGLVFFDPKRSAVFQWNVKADGSITESRITRADSTGFAVLGANTRSTIRRTGPNEMHWILEVPRDSAWQTILDAPHRRRRP